MAKLTAAKIMEAKQLRSTGLTYRRLGEIFGVTPAYIFHAIRGDTWKHLTAAVEPHSS